jgi:hypothetical protein
VLDAAFFGAYVRVHVAPMAAPEMRLEVHLPQGAVPDVGTEIALRAVTWGVLQR